MIFADGSGSLCKYLAFTSVDADAHERPLPLAGNGRRLAVQVFHDKVNKKFPPLYCKWQMSITVESPAIFLGRIELTKAG